MISWESNESSEPIEEIVLCAGDLQNVGQGLEALIPSHLMQFARDDEHRSNPAIARDADASARIERLLCEESSGGRPVSTPSSSTRPIPGLWSGARPPKTGLRR